jgi:hypothetical protein
MYTLSDFYISEMSFMKFLHKVYGNGKVKRVDDVVGRKKCVGR